VGVYSARAATRVASNVLERHLGRPPLVRETSRWTWRPKIKSWPWAKQESMKIFDQIVLEDALEERLQWTTNALVSAQANGTPFRHLLLHGPPGTGKTLFARTLAQHSGLDYAIMSGGDLGPLGREGPFELHKLFAWAARSRRGLVLFVDEADAFLRRGRGGSGGMSEDARNALSVFLHHTGTENARVAVILATNVPSVLDRAVLDRIDEAFEFPVPGYDQRLRMLQIFVDRYLSTPTKRGKGIEVEEGLRTDFLEGVAKRTDGFSGRQLAKLVLAFQAAVFGSGTQRLTFGLAETVLQWRLTHPNV
jgi:ATPase family AAA domain-containing protein 3A/B